MGPKVYPSQRERRDLAWLIVIVASALVLYTPVFPYLWQKWHDDSQYSLAYLVPFVSGYFTWKKWPQVTSLKRDPSPVGLAIILAAVILHLAGTVLDISGPSGLSMILCLLGCCMYLHSKALVKTLAFPFAYLLFMLPVPGGMLDLVGFPLQLWSSGATAVLLRALHIEVVRSGVNLSVPGYDFQVAEACSGMSSLVALVGVTAVFAYITKLPSKYKWILFFMSVPVALVANAVRITTIALVGYEWGPEAATDVYHDWSSPILFLAAIVLLFVVNWGFEWMLARRSTQ